MNERELWKSLIETWIRHREVELDLLRRLERSLDESADQPEPPTPAPTEFVEPPFSAPMEHAAPASPASAQPMEPSSFASMEQVEPSSFASMEQVEPLPWEPAVSSSTPISEPAQASVGETTETSSEHETTETPAEREPATESETEDPAWVAEVPLLLLGQADTWVGFPWDHVERVALSEEVELPQESEYRFSLGAILQVDREEEPYSLVWTQDGGPATLSCARIGGIVTIDGAVDRSIDFVIHPRSEGSDPRPVLLSLGDFIVEMRSQRSAQTPPIPVPPARADESSSGGSDSQDNAGAITEDAGAFASIEASDLADASDAPQNEVDSIYDALPGKPEVASDPPTEAVNATAAPESANVSAPSETIDSSGSSETVEARDLSTSVEDPCEENDLDAGLAELHDEQRTPLDSSCETASDESARAISPHGAEDTTARGSANGLVEHEVEEKILPSRLNGGRRSIPHALVAVHYLPARVAVVRMLRSAGWSVEEEAQPQNLFRRLQGQSPDVLFVEPTGPFSESTQERLHELVASGSRVVVLGSRLRPGQATPEGVLGRAPRLHFPFTEEESRELLGYLRVPNSDPRPTA
jgi:hypothetical protein